MWTPHMTVSTRLLCCLVLVSGLLAIVVQSFSLNIVNERIVNKKQIHNRMSNKTSAIYFTAIGDFGRRGKDNQLEVAQEMAAWCESVQKQCDFTIGVGDNFYEDGVYGTDDPQFKESFEDIYRPRSSFGQFYSAMGNHEYYGYAHAEVLYSLKKNGRDQDSIFYLPNEYYTKLIKKDGLTVLIAVFDTTPMVQSYYTSKKVNESALELASNVTKQLEEMQNQIDELSSKNTIDWKIAVGHHPIKSAGKNGNNDDIGNTLEPMLVKNGFFVYMSGHDHNMQYLNGFHCLSSGQCMNQIVTGGGSKVKPGEINPAHNHLVTYLEESGFSAVVLTVETMEVSFVNTRGHAKQQFSIPNPIHSK